MSNANILLGVNIDHVATLRQARYRDADASLSELVEPDPIALALVAESASGWNNRTPERGSEAYPAF